MTATIKYNILQAISLAEKKECYFREEGSPDIHDTVDNEICTYETGNGEFDENEPSTNCEIGEFIDGVNNPFEAKYVLCDIKANVTITDR